MSALSALIVLLALAFAATIGCAVLAMIVAAKVEKYAAGSHESAP